MNSPAIQIDLDTEEIAFDWRRLRKAVVRGLAAQAHRHAGLWVPRRVELNLPRAWASILSGNEKNTNEFNELCLWLESGSMVYRIAVTAHEQPCLTVY